MRRVSFFVVCVAAAGVLVGAARCVRVRVVGGGGWWCKLYGGVGKESFFLLPCLVSGVTC
jgi:hypothetical protein